MSQFSDYIDKMLKTEFSEPEQIKNTAESNIEIYKGLDNDKKLVKICSKNRNDHIYRLLRGIQHPNLASVYDVSSEENYVIVLEEYIEGSLLKDIMKKGPLSKKVSISYILDLCSALSFLHSQNIIHRDIKPSNVIIDKSNKAVLIDYSSSREMSYVSDGDTVNLGTPGYAAPEQYGIHQSLPATDIYALGVLFNEMLLGTNPILKTPNGRLGKIIKKCISSQMSDRYQSINELEKDIKIYNLFCR